MLLQSSFGFADFFKTYNGHIKYEKNDINQITELDFLTFRDQQNRLQIQAFLKIYFGNQSSHEYLTYYYRNVQYNLIDHQFSLEDPEQDLSVVSTNITSEKIEASVYSTSNGYIGTLTLTDKTNNNLKNIKDNLDGLYLGTCDGKKQKLRVHTFRNNAEFYSPDDPYGQYQIFSQLSEEKAFQCQKKQYCIIGSYPTAFYNFIDGKIIFESENHSLICNKDVNNTINCDNGCSYTPQASSIPRIRSSHPTPNKSHNIIKHTPQPGIYKGFITYSKSLKTRNFEVRIRSFQKKDQLHLTLRSSLDSGGKEKINILYKQKQILPIENSFIFFNSDQTTPYILKINRIVGSKISGILYNALQGRIGSFQVDSSTFGLNPPSMEGLAGLYHSQKYSLKLITNKGSFLGYTSNPFNPNEITGHFTIHIFYC